MLRRFSQQDRLATLQRLNLGVVAAYPEGAECEFKVQAKCSKFTWCRAAPAWADKAALTYKLRGLTSGLVGMSRFVSVAP